MSRRTHCPAGRPIYRPGDARPHLATVSELRTDHRRRLAKDQVPVASYLVNVVYGSGPSYFPLYLITEAVPMRTLSARQQARRAAIRTCPRCGAAQDRPYPVPDELVAEVATGRRLCAGCLEVEAEASWRFERNVARQEATAWARRVLDDPWSVLVSTRVEHCGGWQVQLVYALDLVCPSPGVVEPRAPLADLAIIRGDESRPAYMELLADDPALPVPVDLDQAVSVLRKLRHWRLVAVASYVGVDLTNACSTRFYVEGPDEQPFTVAKDDQVERRYSRWFGARQEHAGAWRYHRGIERDTTLGSHRDHREQARAILRALMLMAADAHPDGPARCPTIAANTGYRCGRIITGPRPLCGYHTSLFLPRPVTPQPVMDGPGPGAVQRACNGCAGHLGDATEEEIAAALLGQELPDVTAECPCCSGTSRWVAGG